MKDKNILLFIVPLPPPVTGQSIISKDVFDHFNKKYKVIALNYQRSSLARSTILNVNQVIRTLKLIKIIREYRDRARLVYMNMSVSFLGNLKDIFILMMLGKLRKKTIIHFHRDGFSGFLNRSFYLIKLLNKYLLKDLHKVIVLGESLKNNFPGIIDEKKISIINNYFEPDILIREDQMKKKWDRSDKLNLLFLSNMILEKGYLDLLHGFLQLENKIQSSCNLFFAGAFDDKKNKKIFFDKIKGRGNICYLENVAGPDKKELLNKSHAFFLPSSILEGQPLSILEAYASGCAVFTTDTGGIKDIFTENANGKYIKGKYDQSITSLITDFVNNAEKYERTAYYNRKYSLNFSKEKFLTGITDLFNELLINE